jgi:hypothetical protein
MLQVKIFEGNVVELEEQINAFLQLSNIEYVDFKILSENKVMLVYNHILPIKWNDIVVHTKNKTS